MSNQAVTQLPLDVWARIFQHLEAVNAKELTCSLLPEARRVALDTANQAHFHQLQLVCSKFRDVFAEHPDLSNRIIVSKSIAHPFIPSILLWIQRWRSSIRNVSCCSGKEHQEMLLGALACPDSMLNTIHLTKASQNSVHALPVFSSLSRCDLHGQQGHLDLTALQALPSLTELHLSVGCFNGVPAACLTYLFVASGIVQFSGASEQNISLETLIVTSSRLSRLHDAGLAACAALSCLHISSSVFSAAHEDDVLDLDGNGITALIPARMSALTCLTELDMRFTACNTGMWYELDWVYSLVALRHLELEVEGAFDVHDDWTQLKDLTYLKLASIAESDNQQDCASYSIDWEPMQALRHLEFQGAISCDTSILQLTSLQGLSCLHLTYVTACIEDDTFSTLARLMYQLAVRCPQVQVYVDKSLVDAPF